MDEDRCLKVLFVALVEHNWQEIDLNELDQHCPRTNENLQIEDLKNETIDSGRNDRIRTKRC